MAGIRVASEVQRCGSSGCGGAGGSQGRVWTEPAGCTCPGSDSFAMESQQKWVLAAPVQGIIVANGADQAAAPGRCLLPRPVTPACYPGLLPRPVTPAKISVRRQGLSDASRHCNGRGSASLVFAGFRQSLNF